MMNPVAVGCVFCAVRQVVLRHECRIVLFLTGCSLTRWSFWLEHLLLQRGFPVEVDFSLRGSFSYGSFHKI